MRVYSTIDCPGTASYDDLAFCFAVYFTAVVSLDEAEAQVILDEDKDSVLHRFKAGLEQALAHGNFLDCPTVTALSAFATYLVWNPIVVEPTYLRDETKQIENITVDI